MCAQGIRQVRENEPCSPDSGLRHLLILLLDLQVIQYELGILLCALLGLLFAILMPLAGLCFGLCRCNRKCGGEMHQRQKRNEAFMRKYYALSLLVLCLLMRRVESRAAAAWVLREGGLSRVLPVKPISLK